jgi:hypothetical protein
VRRAGIRDLNIDVKTIEGILTNLVIVCSTLGVEQC